MYLQVVVTEEDHTSTKALKLMVVVGIANNMLYK